MRNISFESSVLFSMFPSGLCAGICAGEGWELVEHNAALAAFFSKQRDEHGKYRPREEDFKGVSLFSLLYRGGAEFAADAIRSSKEGSAFALALRTKQVVFAWSLISNTSEPLRFFFFHEMPFEHPAENPCDVVNRELQAIMDSMHDGIWVIDSNGITVHVNKALKRIANIEPENMIGKHVAQSMKEGLFHNCVTLNALEEKRVVTMFDDYPCGTRCLNTSTPIFDDNGEIWRVVASIRDMTELEDLQKRLAEAERTAHMYKGRLDTMEQNRASGFIATSKIMRACVKKLEKAAKAPSGILILGETGTGKTFASSLIHQKSPRADAPFITVNCAAIPPTLIESELFGYEKGAFTGAVSTGKKGYFEAAHKGTLLLDEIGELPLAMQAKLLHILDNQTFHRVGGQKPVTVDVRIIAATNRPLEQLVEKGEFRADLYYRLRVLCVQIPPLREHPEDIAELAMTFLDEACKRHGITKTLSPKLLKSFALHDWPGNVRELRAAVEFLAAMTEGSIIRISDLPPNLMVAQVDGNDDDTEPPQGLKQAVNNLERSMIGKALAQTGSSYKAAAILGVSQSTVVRKARQLGLRVVE